MMQTVMTERKKNRRIRRNERKTDLAANPEGTEDVVAGMTAREALSGRFPLRIDARTVIFVPREKCTPEYAAAYRERINRTEHRGGPVV